MYDKSISNAELESFRDLAAPFADTLDIYDPDLIITAEQLIAGDIIEASPEAFQFVNAQTRARDKLSLRELFENNPDHTNAELIRILQKDPNVNVDHPRFREMYEFWDSLREGAEPPLLALRGDTVPGPMLTAENRAMLAKAMSADFETGDLSMRDILGMSSKGDVLWNRSALGRWLQKQKMSLAVAPMFISLNNALSYVSDTAVDFVNWGLTAFDFLTTGDPTQLIVRGLASIAGEIAIGNQRRIDNRQPDQWRGSRYGYVRKGDKWIPALVSEVEKSTGVYQRNRTVTFEYGDTLTWVRDGTGQWVAKFEPGPNTGSESFHTTDYEMLKNYSYEYGQEHDFLRNWYLVEPNEQTELVTNTSQGKAWDGRPTEVPDDPYFKRLDEWRQALDAKADFDRRDTVPVTYPTSRGLHESYWKEKGHDDIDAMRFGNYMGVGAKLTKERRELFGSQFNPEDTYLMDSIFRTSLEDLRRTYDQVESSVRYRLPEFPAAQSFTELNDQLNVISTEMTDNPEEALNFLTQKAIARYWVNQITDLKGADKLAEYTLKPIIDPDFGGIRGQGLVTDFEKFNGKWVHITDENGFNLLRESDEIPWANRGEGFFPDDSVTVSGGLKKLVETRVATSQTFQNDQYDAFKPKVSEELLEQIRDTRESAPDVVDGVEVNIGGTWKLVTSHTTIRYVTTLTFADGTTQEYDNRKAAVNLHVRESVAPIEGERERLQEILDRRPDLYKLLQETHEQLSSDLTGGNEYDWQVNAWLNRFLRGDARFSEFPKHIVTIDGTHVQIGGEEVHIDDLHHDEVTGTISIEKDGKLIQIEQYIREQMGEPDVDVTKITAETNPEIAFTADGSPALYGDAQLAGDLGLPENIAAVKDASGGVHTFYRPEGVLVGPQ